MAKSKIIRDLANGDVDVAKALKRLKALLYELNDPIIDSWINNELTGYHVKANLPNYRTTKGVLIGTFLVGTPSRALKYENCPLPISKGNDSIRNDLLTVNIYDSVSTIQQIISSKDAVGAPIPPEVYPILQNGTNISTIISATVKVDSSFLQNIIANVDSILLDMLCVLEKKFGNLDELDFEMPEDKTEKEILLQCLTQFIFIDKSINIGNENRITDSEVKS